MSLLDPARRTLMAAGDLGDLPPMGMPLAEAPLSPGQESLWFLLRSLPDAAAYNMAATIALPEGLSPALARTAWELAVDRHPAMRTVVIDTDDGPRQRLTSAASARPAWDVRDLGVAGAESVTEFLARSAATPFSDFERRVPARATLLLLPGARRLLAVAMHHILSDGWSMHVLRRDLTELASALVEGRSPVLPALGSDHLDYAMRVRARAASEHAQRSRAWWRDELAGLDGPLELPTEHDRGSAGQPRGASLPVLLPPPMVTGLVDLCRASGTNLFVGLVAVISVLLHRVSGSQDVPVGTPRAQRGPHEEEIVGFCVQTLLLRIRVDPDITFQALLERARDTVHAAFEHEDVPFETLVADTAGDRKPGQNPLFETMIALQTVPGSDVPSVGQVPDVVRECAARFELSFFFTQVAEGLLGSIEFRADLFPVDRVRLLRDQFRTLWASVLAAPETRVSQLRLCGPGEVQTRDAVSQGPRRSFQPLVDLIWARLSESGDQTALRGLGTEATYAELGRRVAGWQAGLVAAGLGRGDRAVVALGRGPDAVAALLACLMARVAYIPVDPEDPPDHLAALAKSAGASGVLVEQVAAWCANLAVVRPADAPGPVAPAPGGPDDCAYIIHTSGSTGQPKGAALAHRTLDNLIGWQLESFRAPVDATTLQFAPVGFDVSVQEVTATIAGGGTLVLVDRDTRRDPAALLEHCRSHNVRRAFLPPLMMRELVSHLERRGEYAQLDEVICAGEALIVPRGVGRLLTAGGVLVNQYGPAETHVVTAHVLDGDPSGWPTMPPIGLPIANVTVAVTDPWTGPAPLCAPGELVISGPAVGLGYVSGGPADKPFQSRDLQGSPTPCYVTGDRVVQALDGTLTYQGRLDRQVKIRGFRVEPGHIEAVLERDPRVRAAAVGAVDRPSGDRMLVAWVEADEDLDWRDGLGEALPRHLVPDLVMTLAALPRTSSGKIDRSLLPVPGERSGAPRATPPGSPSVLALVQECCEQLLGGSISGRAHNFFALGGDSLTAMRLASRLEARLGLPVSVRDVFDCPDLSVLAAELESRGAVITAEREAADPADRAEVVGTFPATSNQSGLWFLGQLEPGDGAYNLTIDLDLPTGVRTGAVATALTVLANRHPSLRTSLRLDDADLVQLVHRPTAVPVREVNLPDLPAPEAAELVRRLAEQESKAPFAAGEVLMRAMLLRDPRGPTHLVMVIHHAVADGWSLDVLRAELADLLAGRRLGPRPTSFVEWSLAHGRVGDHKADQYWIRQLEGADPVLDLPLDNQRKLRRSTQGTARAVALGAGTSAGLRRVAGEVGSTPFAALLALTCVLLGRLASTGDVVVGVPMANRGSGLEGTVGYLANTVVIRSRLPGDATFRELVGSVGELLLDAQEHQDMQFESLVRILNPDRSPGLHPVFQVMCSYDSGRSAVPGAAAREIPAGSVDSERSRRTVAKYDLSWAFEAALGPGGEERFLVGIEHRDDIIEPATGRGWLAALAALADSAAADPDLRISQLSFGRPRPIDHSTPARQVEGSFLDHIVACAVRRPDSPAVLDDRGGLTYAELLGRANSLANTLEAHPVGSLVGVLARPGRDLVTAWLGVLLAGHTLVPLDPELPAGRLAEIQRDAGVAVMVTDGESPSALDLPQVSVPTKPATDIGPPPRPVRTDAPAYVLFTSGTTGRPKGVVVSRPALTRYLTDTREMFELDAHDRVLQFAAPGFDVAIEEILGALAAGACVVPRPSGPCPPDELIEHCRVRGVTVLSVATSYFAVVAQWCRSHDLPEAIRLAVIGGEQLEIGTLADWSMTGLPVWNMYGPTEATISAVAARLTRPEPARPPIGRPLPSARAYVLDEQQRPLPDYVPGELYLGGLCLAEGYLSGDDADMAGDRSGPNPPSPFATDPFSIDPTARMYRTGDRVWTRADGCLVHLGRTNDQVKVRGFRVELGAVDDVLRADPAVLDATTAVTSREQLVAGVVLAEQVTTFDAEALRAAVRARLPGYMVPAVVVALENLPVTSSGKPDRARLAAILAEDREATPATGQQSPLARLWQELLGLLPGPQDDFFALGGHSLLLLRLHARIESELGVRLPVGTLMGASGFAAMRELVEHGGQESPVVGERTIPAQSATEAPATSSQARIWYADHATPGAYHLSLRIDVDDAVVPGAFATAFDWLLARHPALRTVFASTATGLVQRLLDAPKGLLRVVDLSDNPLAGDVLARVLGAEATRSFDLSSEPPIRAVAVTLSPTRHVVALTCHHIAVDGISMDIIGRDFQHYHREASRGLERPPQPSTPTYLDYAQWDAQRVLDPDVLDRAESLLDGVGQRVPLPFDRSLAAAESAPGVCVPFALAGSWLGAVDRLARNTRTTRFAVLGAAWFAFLAELGGVEDLVVGTPVANRPAAMADVVGCFVNTLPLRIHLDPDDSWQSAARSVGDRVTALLDLQHVPLDELVGRGRQRSETDRAAPFDVCFVVQDARTQAVPQWAPPRRSAVKFDLTLTLEPSPQGCQGYLEARSSRLDDATAELWARWFCEYAEALSRAPATALREIAWARTEPAQQDDGGPNRPVAVVPAFLAKLRDRPDAVALTVLGRRWSRAELAQLSAGVAGELAAVGVGPGARVALCVSDPARRIAAMLACLSAGAAFVPVDMSQPEGRRRRVLAAAAVTFVLDDQPTASEPVALSAAPHAPETPAYVMFTSGSSGAPKGVVIGHGALSAHVGAFIAMLDLDEREVYSHVASCGFDAAIAETMPALAVGGAIAVAPAGTLDDVASTLSWLDSAAVTVAYLPTPLGELAFGEIERDARREPGSLRVLYVGGAQLRRSPPAMRARVFNLYGPTEATVAATGVELSSASSPGVPSIGVPIPGTRVRVVAADGQSCATGQPGELVLGGDKVALGYFDDPERTRAAFSFEPGLGWCYRTGDLVRWRTDGALDFLGRTDRQVQVRGVRVEPAEIEAALLRLPGVRLAHVTVEAGPLDEQLTAWLEVDRQLGATARRAGLAADLPAVMVPSAFVELERLPVNANGKIDAQALRDTWGQLADQAGAGPAAGADDADPLVGWWVRCLSQTLGRPVDPDTDFFSAGGHSLLAMQVLARGREDLGVELRVVDFLSGPTARGLAERSLEWADLAVAMAGTTALSSGTVSSGIGAPR